MQCNCKIVVEPLSLQMARVYLMALLLIGGLSILLVGSVSGAPNQERLDNGSIEFTLNVSEERIVAVYTVSLSDGTFETFSERSTDQGYNSTASYVLAEVIDDEIALYTDVSIQEHHTATEHVYTYKFRNLTVNDHHDYSAAVEDNRVKVNIVNRMDPRDIDQISEVSHAITMPGEIAETNANTVEDSTAVWNHSEAYTYNLFVASDIGGDSNMTGAMSDSTEPSRETNNTDTESDEPSSASSVILGITVVVFIMSVVSVWYAWKRVVQN
jgi:hypothetical protein